MAGGPSGARFWVLATPLLGVACDGSVRLAGGTGEDARAADADEAADDRGADETCDPAAGPFGLRGDEVVAVPASAESPVLVRSAGGYAAAWSGRMPDGLGPQVHFARLSPDGHPVGPTVRVGGNGFGTTPPSLATNGTEFGVAWSRFPGGPGWDTDLYFRRLAASGEPIGPELRVTDAPGSSTTVDVVWTGGEWMLAWSDERDDPTGSVHEIYIARISAAGSMLGPELRLTYTPDDSWRPALAVGDGAVGVAWIDGNYVLFARISLDGEPIGEAIPVAGDPGARLTCALAWSGSEYGVVWDEGFYPEERVAFARVSGNGREVGAPFVLTTCLGTCAAPDIEWLGTGYAVAWSESPGGAAGQAVLLLPVSPAGAALMDPIRVTGAETLMPSRPWLAFSGLDGAVVWTDGALLDGPAVFFRRVGGCWP